MNHQQMVKPMLIGVAVLFALGLAGLPVLDYLPLLILLACPLMMLSMRRGMQGGSERGDDHDRSPAGPNRRDEP